MRFTPGPACLDGGNGDSIPIAVILVCRGNSMLSPYLFPAYMGAYYEEEGEVEIMQETAS